MNLISSLFSGIVTFVLQILGFIAGLIINPILGLLELIIPDLSSYYDIINNFLINYFFKAISFAREIFFNISGASRTIFNIFIGLFFARITFKYTLQGYHFIRNMWRLYKTGQGGGSMEE